MKWVVVQQLNENTLLAFNSVKDSRSVNRDSFHFFKCLSNILNLASDKTI